MTELPDDLQHRLREHPVGTFAFVAIYAVLFVIGWFAIYLLVYLSRHPVSA